MQSTEHSIMNCIVKTFILPVLLMCCMTSVASARSEKDTVTWLLVDWPPSWIFKGAEQNKGYGDLIEEQLFEVLNTFYHQKSVVTFARLVMLLGKDENACTSTGFYQWPDKNGVPRDDLVWSAPILMFEWHGLVIPQSKLHRLGAVRPVSLKRVFELSGLTLVIQKGRDLGTQLNELVYKKSNTSNIFTRNAGGNTTQTIYGMLLKNRGDYTIDYRFMVDYFNQYLAPEGQELVYLSIKESKPGYGYGAVVCTNSPLGQLVISAVNQNIEDWRNKGLRKVNQKWFAPKTEDEAFWHHWETDFSAIKD